MPMRTPATIGLMDAITVFGIILIVAVVFMVMLGRMVYVQSKRADALEEAARLRVELAEVDAKVETLTAERDFAESELADLIVGFEMVTDPRPTGG